MTLADGSVAHLSNVSQFVGYQGEPESPSAILLTNNGLHIDVQIDRSRGIGKDDPAGVADVILEAALSTILDLEDSVAAVDADDKVLAYQNCSASSKARWLKPWTKNGKTITRTLNKDRIYTAGAGDSDARNGTVRLHGRSMLFLRNVGHLMTNSVLLDENGNEVPEGDLDAVVTTLIALHDIRRDDSHPYGNPLRTGSVYIVKPKMHGPAEVAFANELFGRVEKLLGLNNNTVKLGIMDEERRTTVNLMACINEARGRVAFINTGFPGPYATRCIPPCTLAR